MHLVACRHFCNDDNADIHGVNDLNLGVPVANVKVPTVTTARLKALDQDSRHPESWHHADGLTTLAHSSTVAESSAITPGRAGGQSYR